MRSPSAPSSTPSISFVILATVVYFFIVVPYTKAKEQLLPRRGGGHPRRRRPARGDPRPLRPAAGPSDLVAARPAPGDGPFASRPRRWGRERRLGTLASRSAVVRRHLVAIPVVALAGARPRAGRGRPSSARVRRRRRPRPAAAGASTPARECRSGPCRRSRADPGDLLAPGSGSWSLGGLARRLGRGDRRSVGSRRCRGRSPGTRWGSRSRTRWPGARRRSSRRAAARAAPCPR